MSALPLSDTRSLPPNWHDPRAGGHSVQFYKDDSVLIDALARFIQTAVSAGESSIVIATPPHRKLLRSRLLRDAMDVERAIKQGRYVELDAAQLLTCFMVKEWPDEQLFRKTLGPVIEKANAAAEGPQPRVAAFGEMVSVLWERDRFEAAIRLEKLWNELAENHSFCLRCAYPIQGFFRSGFGERLRNVCKEHSCVFTSECYDR